MPRQGSWPLFTAIVSVLAALVLATLFWPGGALGRAPAEGDGLGTAASAQSGRSPGTAPASTPTSTPTAPGTPAPTNTPVTPSTPEADAVVSTFLNATGEEPALESAEELNARLAEVASGPILLEIANEQQELQSNGWTLEGSPTVTSLSVVASDLTVSPPRVTVRACVDSSAVVTLDSTGTPLNSGATELPRRFINLYTLEQTAGQWRVTDRSFPNDPAC
jgi:hypothetical protein